MATVVRIKAAVFSAESGDFELPTPPQGRIQGRVRLWYEQPSPPAAPGTPLTPTNKYIVVGEDIGPTSGPVSQRYGEDIRSGDVARVGGWSRLLTERGISLADYTSGRTFSADLALPASIIDAYMG